MTQPEGFFILSKFLKYSPQIMIIYDRPSKRRWIDRSNETMSINNFQRSRLTFQPRSLKIDILMMSTQMKKEEAMFSMNKTFQDHN